VTAAAAAAAGLRGRVLRGVAWKFGSQVSLQVSRLAVAIVLAHLLTPQQFGVAAMAILVSSLVILFSDLALGAALIRRRTLNEDDKSTVFWTSLAASSVLTGLGVITAGPLARFYHAPEVKPLFAVLSISFVLSALGATQSSLLVREMQFRALETRTMIGTFAGATTGILLAAFGFGAWAIIAQQLAMSAVSTVLLWHFSPWRPRLRFSISSLRSLGGFGLNVFLQRLFYYLHRNADNLLIGRFVGAAALGAYTVAYNVMLVPFSRVAGPLQEVMFPAFSEIQDDPRRIAVIWLRVTRLVGAISIPSLLGLMIVAPDLVTVVLGQRWQAAIPVVRILAWVGLLQSLQTMNGDILQALDRTGSLARYSFLFFSAHLLAFAIGVHWGIVGVATAYAISSTIIEPIFAFVTCRALGVSPLELTRALSGVAQAALAMAAIVLLTDQLVLTPEVPAGARLACLVTEGAIAFALLGLWRAPELVADLRALLRHHSDSQALEST
jgi:O-antigen/teichoic acid export membrane protein